MSASEAGNRTRSRTDVAVLSLDPFLAERRATVLELRRQGWPFRRIAEELDISPSLAHNDFTIAMKALVPVEEIAEMRRLEADRLDHLQVLACQLVENPKVPVTARLAALDRALAIGVRRAKLLGLDAPAQVEHSGTVEVNVDVRQRAEHLRDELEERRRRSAAA